MINGIGNIIFSQITGVTSGKDVFEAQKVKLLIPFGKEGISPFVLNHFLFSNNLP